MNVTEPNVWKPYKDLQSLRERLGYFSTLAIGFLFLGACVFLMGKSGVFWNWNKPLVEGEVDLSGVWKVSLSDSPSYKDIGFNDSKWCEIGVPNGFLIPKGQQADHCAEFFYDRDKFRNTVLWYRKKLTIADINRLQDPSLFLGAVKGLAKIFINGILIGMARVEDAPSIFIVPKEILRTGPNQLSIRVETADAQYPGIFHAYARGVVLGEYKNNILGRFQLIDQTYVEPITVMIIQILCLVVSLILVFYGFGASQVYRWLTIYFGSGALYGFVAVLIRSPELEGSFRHLLETVGGLGMVFGSTGYAMYISNRRFSSWSFMVFGLCMFATQISGVYYSVPTQPFRDTLNGLAIICMFTLIAVSFVRLIRDPKKASISEILIGAGMTALCTALFAVWRIPKLSTMGIHLLLYTSLLSLALLLLSVREYMVREKALSFFGRFIRPGLKALLNELGDKVAGERKVFRGRRIPVVKLDIVGHTSLTYRMPYGMKRLFQDLWFNKVDTVFRGLTFLDKNEGDGSIYCIREDAHPLVATATIEAVIRLRSFIVADFFEEFKSQLKRLIIEEPEIAPAVETYLERYNRHHDQSFFDQRVQVYSALVYGYVDEGLWGIPSRGHYDVQGDLITLAARIEAEAEASDILVDEAFALKLSQELGMDSLNCFEWQTINLRGLGEKRIGKLKALEQIPIQRLQENFFSNLGERKQSLLR